MQEKVLLSEIVANPFRNFDRCPIVPEVVDSLVESMERTGFWSGLIGRRKDDGVVELAFGHHRWLAYKVKYGDDARMPVDIRKISDEDMLRFLLDENSSERTSSDRRKVALEAIRSVVLSYAEGKIELEKPRRIDNSTRYAPSFRKNLSPYGDDYPYNTITIAKFLGWTKKGGKNGIRASQRVEGPLIALEKEEVGDLEAPTNDRGMEPDLLYEFKQCHKRLLNSIRKMFTQDDLMFEGWVDMLGCAKQESILYIEEMENNVYVLLCNGKKVVEELRRYKKRKPTSADENEDNEDNETTKLPILNLPLITFEPKKPVVDLGPDLPEDDEDDWDIPG